MGIPRSGNPADAQQAAHHVLDVVHGIPRRRRRAEGPLSLGEQRLAGPSQLHPPGGAQEQRGAKFPFEPSDGC